MASSEAPVKAHQWQLMRNGLSSLALKVFSTLLSFILAIDLARLLGPEGYGIYSFVFSMLTLLAVPLLSGMPHLLVRETARALARSDFAVVGAIWKWNLHLILLLATLLGILGFFLWQTPNWIAPVRRETMFAGLILVPALALVNTQGAVLRGLGKVILGQIPYNVGVPALFLILMLVVWLSPWTAWSPQFAMLLHSLAAILACLGGGFLLKRLMKKFKAMPATRDRKKGWLNALMPLTLVTGFQLINSYADIILLGLMRTDGEVGIYRVAVQMSGLVTFGLAAINQVLHPQFSRLYAEGHHDRLQKLVTGSARIILMIAIPPVLVFLLYGGELVELLFGFPYLATTTALQILALGQLANAGFGSVGALLNMTGHERDTLRGMFAALVVNFLLNLTLIPRFGPEGAATATAVSYLVWNVLLRRFVKMRLDIESTGWALRTS